MEKSLEVRRKVRRSDKPVSIFALTFATLLLNHEPQASCHDGSVSAFSKARVGKGG
jgi:hypothetical protein